MLKIKYSNEIETRHLEYFECNILPKFFEGNKMLNYEYQKHHEEFMEYCKINYKKLAIGKPEELKEFFANIPNLSQELLLNNPFINEKINYNEYLLSIFGYKRFSTFKGISEELLTYYNALDNDLIKKYWTPYTLLFMCGIRVCPYCNRQYITPLYYHSNEKSIKLRADLDHFYPKSKYPYFSMSLYNLVPCCKFCNTSLKGRKEFSFTDVNPFEADLNDYFKFKVDILNCNKITVEKNCSNKIDNYLNIFQIESLYDYHRNQAEDLIKKKNVYSDTYVDELYNLYSELFVNKKALKSFILGNNLDKKRIHDEAFFKFRRDISIQLQLTDEYVSEGLIIKLKNMIKINV